MNANRLISEENFLRLTAIAKSSPRGRINHNFHELSEVYQRFLNVLTENTYIQPHKHTSKPETFIALKGEIACFLFDDNGNVTERYLLSGNGPVYGIDILPGTYHTIVCLTESAACFEGKSGPYIPDADKEFARWAPAENDGGAKNYLGTLKNTV